MDYISREAIAAEAQSLSTHLLNEWDTMGVLALIDRQPAADVRPVKWIPVTERLPEFEGAVLCMRKSIACSVRPYQEILYVDEFGFQNFDDIYLADGVVTHWMPLPEPPTAEEE